MIKISKEDIRSRLSSAVRQYRHNNDNSGSPCDPEQGFVVAYSKDEVDSLIDDILDKGVSSRLGVVRKVLMDDVSECPPVVIIVTSWGAIPFTYKGDDDVQRLVDQFNDPSERDNGWATWFEEDLDYCYNISSRFL